ncbi:MAG TPA: FtsW/RodA/SpoVE family cell cycle protein, partial [Thermoanaerobaculia bacterium]|nr:FtsW/RodA/SpoVE family cell cycle protein [Thermoanaerobaculia bacterium]
MAKKLAFDKVLFTTVTLLLAFGLVMVYSASAALARRQQPLTFNPFLIKQAVAAGLGLVLMIWLMVLDYRKLRRPAVIYSLLFGVMALLVLVLFA